MENSKVTDTDTPTAESGKKAGRKRKAEFEEQRNALKRYEVKALAWLLKCSAYFKLCTSSRVCVSVFSALNCCGKHAQVQHNSQPRLSYSPSYHTINYQTRWTIRRAPLPCVTYFRKVEASHTFGLTSRGIRIHKFDSGPTSRGIQSGKFVS